MGVKLFALFCCVFHKHIFFSGLASAAVPPVNQTRNLMPDVFELISLNVKGISNLKKGEQCLLGAENEKRT